MDEAARFHALLRARYDVDTCRRADDDARLGRDDGVRLECHEPPVPVAFLNGAVNESRPQLVAPAAHARRMETNAV